MRVERAIQDIADGRPVVVVDDADRENEGDIIVAASKMTPALMAFMIRHTSGVICVPLPGAHLDRLQLPLMTPHNSERMRTAFTISVDARDGVTTGISAEDRARTVRTLVDSATEPYEIVRPGHIFPLRYAEGGVLRRPGHTEAAVDLARLAGLDPAGVLAEVVNDDGTMARLPQLRAFADEHGLALISIAQLIEYRRHSERQVRRVVETRLPNAYGQWRALGYQNSVDQTEHVVLVLGDLGDGRDVLVRAHSECLTGDVFGSRRCDCGDQLEASMAAIAAEGRGVVLYLRGHEGRGIGLLSKLRAYQLQDAGRRHRGRQPGTRPARRRAGVLDRRPDPRRPRGALGAPAHQQPGQGQRAVRVRHRGGRAGGAAGHPHPGEPALPDRQAGPARSPDRRPARHRSTAAQRTAAAPPTAVARPWPGPYEWRGAARRRDRGRAPGSPWPSR